MEPIAVFHRVRYKDGNDVQYKITVFHPFWQVVLSESENIRKGLVTVYNGIYIHSSTYAGKHNDIAFL